MKRLITIFLSAIMLMCTLMALTMPVLAATSDQPSLVAVSFKNAKIDKAFDENVQEYTITLDDNTVSPTLERYGVRGEADIFINYTYDETNHQTGLTVTLQYNAGSRIYNFSYSNPPVYAISDNNYLSAIYSPYGVLSPALNEEDTAYKLYIPSDLTTLAITPVTSDINAYCAPVELTLSPEQAPKITLTCISSDGGRRSYSLDIKRVDKTTEQVIYEMQQPDYKSFVEGTRLFERPEFIISVTCISGGILLIMLLLKVTRRIAVNPYDKDEKPFYSTVE